MPKKTSSSGFCRCPDCKKRVKKEVGYLYNCKRCKQWFTQQYLKGYWLGFRDGRNVNSK